MSQDRDLEFVGRESLAELFCIGPMFKLRDCLDGDFVIGCHLRCGFCLLRMFRAGHTQWRNYFDNLLNEGRFVRLATARGMVEFLKASKWFVPNSMPLIIGGRSDASSQWADIKKFLPMLAEVAPRTRVFLLHRAPFPNWVADWMRGKETRQAILGMSITPGGFSRGWTSVPESEQIASLAPIVAAHGLDRLSIEVRPVTPENLAEAKEVLAGLAATGVTRVIVGGLCFGGQLLDRMERFEAEKLATPEVLAALPKSTDGEIDPARAIKNWLTSKGEAEFYAAAGQVGVTVWRKMICFNQQVLGMRAKWYRENKERQECLSCQFLDSCRPKTIGNTAEVETALTEIGITGRVVEENGVLHIKNETPISEDDLYWLFYRTGASPLVDGSYMIWPDDDVVERWYATRFIDREAMHAAATL